MVVENMTASFDDKGEAIFAFIIQYVNEPEKKHIFSCLSLSHCQQWVVALRQARSNKSSSFTDILIICFLIIQYHSYEHLRLQLKILESKVESLGGKVCIAFNNSAFEDCLLVLSCGTIDEKLHEILDFGFLAFAFTERWLSRGE